MEYTQYWDLDSRNQPDEPEWLQFCLKAYTIIWDNQEIIEEPEINGKYIAFNGIGENAHEDFVLEHDKHGFGFCKTAEKPYDSVVVEILQEAKDRFPNGSLHPVTETTSSNSNTLTHEK